MNIVPSRGMVRYMTTYTLRQRGLVVRYGVALASIALIALVRAMLHTVLDSRSPYTLFLLVLPLVAWFSGLGPGVIALILGGCIGTFLFIPSLNSFQHDIADLLALVIYILGGSMTVYITDALAVLYFRLRRRTEQLEEEVRQRLITEALLRSKEQQITYQLTELEAVYQNSPVGLCIFDTEGRFLRINDKLAEMNGLSVADHLGRSLFEIFPQDAAAYRVLFDQVKTTGEPVLNAVFDSQPQNRPSSLQYSIAHWIPLKNPAGQLVGIHMVVEDITPLKEVENALRTSETRFRLALKNARLTIAHSDLDLRYTWVFDGVNPVAASFIGKRDDELLPQPLAATILDLKQRAIEAETALQIETEASSDGREASYILTAEPSYNEQQAVNGVYTTALDITERTQAERRTSLLYEVAAALASVSTLPEIAQVVLEQAFKLLGGTDTGGLRVLDEDGKALAFVGVHGPTDAVSTYYATVALDASVPAAEAMRTGKPIWVESLEEYHRRYPDLFTNDVPAITVRSLFCIPMLIKGRPLGTLAAGFFHDRKFTTEEREYCVAVAQVCAQAVERAQLTEKAREAAAIEERQRLARDLHDSVNQALFAATTIAESIPRIWAKNPERAVKLLESVVLTNRGAMAEMRKLLIELRPEAILRTGLPDLLTYLIDAAKGRTVIEAELRVHVEDESSPLPPDVHIAFYRIAQEAIHNVLKHSRATRLIVDMKQFQDWATLVISDDGRGFEMGKTAAGLGVGTMRERAMTIKADFELTSGVGKGTSVHVHWHNHTAQVE